MKKSVEILGLPIISITEGRELGSSKSLLIDAQNGSVAALIIEDEDWFRGVKLLPYDSVIAIGDDAITITNSENILKLAEATDYEPLLNQNVRVIGTKAITKAGSIQGVVSEIVIGESGKIAKCTIATENETDTKDIAAEQISIFGKQVTIIDCELPEEAQLAQKKTKSAAPVKPVAPVEQKPVEEVPAPAPAPVESPAEAKEAAPEEKTEVKAEPEKAAAPAPEPAKAPENQAKQLSDKAVEERHRRFLLGKKAARRIATDNGIVIVEAGADITEEVLQKAKLANKFIELSMNVQ
ncbi:MAG: PRC-barrel domain-containing protein [Selenomonadaceae bacterium]|jgi:uncharacterized protein YrrD